MADKKQKTRPKEGKPIEIPVPKRKDFDKLLERATNGKPGPKSAQNKAKK